jgi:hypothetical protein
MANIVTIGADVAETALVMMPELANVPILGRIIVAIAGGHISDGEAIEQLQELAEKKKTERKTRKEQNARYVLKASDAMECVEKGLMDGTFLLAIGRGIANAILGRPGFAPDLILEQIWQCIEEHVLRQDTPRVKKDVIYSARPARGHGKGRT